METAQPAKLSRAIEVEQMRDWRVRLLKIAEPIVRYSDDHDKMRADVIKQNSEIARSLIEEIEKEMGAFL